jgi:hypothetical protein
MGYEQILSSLLSSAPMAAVMFYMWWNERKERVVTQQKLEKYLSDNADRLLKFADEQRTCIGNNTQEMKTLTRELQLNTDAVNRFRDRPSSP